MAEVPFSELTPELLAVAPTAPVPVIVRAVRNAARYLCEQAACYRHAIDGEPVTVGEQEVEFVLPENTTLVKPITLTLEGGYPLKPRSQALLDQDNPNWRAERGRPAYYYLSTEFADSIMLAPIPETTYSTGVKGEVAIMPTRTATGIEEIFLIRYESTLIEGALARLLNMAGKTWADPAQAAYHESMFERRVLDARTRAESGNMGVKRTVAYGGI